MHAPDFLRHQREYNSIPVAVRTMGPATGKSHATACSSFADLKITTALGNGARFFLLSSKHKRPRRNRISPFKQ